MKENQASLLSGSIDTDVMDTPNLLPDETQTLVIHQNNNNKIVESHSTLSNSDLSDLSESKEDPPWTTVERRRARSLSSINGTQKPSLDKVSSAKHFTSEQKYVLRTAAATLTDERQQQSQHRPEKVRVRHDMSLSSRGKGPSKAKGKTIDPGEWGNANLSQESLDIELQTAALNSFKLRDKPVEYPKQKHHYRKKAPCERESHIVGGHPVGNNSYGYNGQACQGRDHGLAKARLTGAHVPPQPAESRPAAQKAPKSYLGMALQLVELGQSQYPKQHDNPSPSPSPLPLPNGFSRSGPTSSGGSRSSSVDTGSSESSYSRWRRRR